MEIAFYVRSAASARYATDVMVAMVKSFESGLRLMSAPVDGAEAREPVVAVHDGSQDVPDATGP